MAIPSIDASCFAMQAIALLRSKTLPRWQGILFLIGVLLVAVPDGMEIINLSASILMAIAFVPYGIQLMLDIAPAERPVGKSLFASSKSAA